LYFSIVKEKSPAASGGRELVLELADGPCFKGNSPYGIYSQGNLWQIRMITEQLQ
jgi:hypothetical protein